ncbi:MAG: hypothetical protein WAW41_04185, partial [Methylobacter sp.]
MEDHNNTIFGRNRLIDRGIDELIGICKGIIFDGVVNYPEAANLMIWLNNNPLIVNRPPAKDLYQQLPALLIGNQLNADGEAKFLSLLQQITGSPAVMFEGDNP